MTNAEQLLALQNATGAAEALVIAATETKLSQNQIVSDFGEVKRIVDEDLNNVDNTSDTNKPISDATATALDLLVTKTSLSTVNGIDLNSGTDLIIARSATSLSTVTYLNRNNLRLMSPEAEDSITVELLGLFQWVATQNEPDEDTTCFNTDTVGYVGQWLLEVPAVDYIHAMLLFENSINNEWAEDESGRFSKYILNNT